MASNADARVEGEVLLLSGNLDRAAAARLWPQLARRLGGVRKLDLRAVEGVDSAGVALLAELAAQLRDHGGGAIDGSPPGLDELRAAYRLSPQLDFNDSSAGS